MLAVNNIRDEAMEKLARTYQAQQLSVVRGLVPAETIEALLRETCTVPATLVTSSRYRPTWDRDISWPSQEFNEGHPVHTFFGHPDLIEITQRLSQANILNIKRLCWATSCRKGQEVGPHRDITGLVHLIIGLKSTESPEHGGELVAVLANGAEERVFLEPGDAVWFDAKHHLHYTTPLITSVKNPDPQRVVIVGRYYES